MCYLVFHVFHLIFFLCGGVFFWWWIRSRQMDFETAIYKRIVQQCRFYQRYQENGHVYDPSTVVAELLAALFSSSDARWKEMIHTKDHATDRIFVHTNSSQHTQIKDHVILHTCDLPAPISTKLVHLIDTLVSEYITSWYTPISADPQFPSQIQYLLTQLSTQLIAKCLAINSFQALQLTSNILDILRLHFKWFREAYASQSRRFPDAFRSTNSQDASAAQSALQKQLLASYAKESSFLHPACSTSQYNSEISTSSDSETNYLRHFVMQIFQNISPEFSTQPESNFCNSAAFALLREVLVTQCISPLIEYLSPPYITEIICATLKRYATPFPNAEIKDEAFLPNANTFLDYQKSRKLEFNPAEFLYHASQQSAGNAEAVFSLIADFAASAAASAASTANNVGQLSSSSWSKKSTREMDESEVSLEPHWTSKTDDPSELTPPLEKKSAIASIFKGNSIGSKLISGNFPISPPNSATQFEDFRNKTADIQSSLNSSLTKVKKRFQTFSNGNVMDGAFHKSLPLASSQATKMIKRPGFLLQKALRRNDMIETMDENAEQVWSEGRASVESEALEAESSDEKFPIAESLRIAEDHEHVLMALESGVASFVHQKVEMLSSARSGELYELLAALEQVFLLGFHHPIANEMTEKISLSVEIASDEYYWEFLAIDRAGNAEMNALWRHVASTCPPCTSSRFLSPRGIQWMLLALEKRQLSDHISILASDREQLVRFYHVDMALLPHGTACTRLCDILQRLENLHFHFEIQSLLGQYSEYDPNSTKELGNGINVVQIAWEIERYDIAIGWTQERDDRHDALPSSEWLWTSSWKLAELEYYEYSNESDASYHEKEEKLDRFRRRKWIRKRYQLPFVIEAISPTILESISTEMEESRKANKMTRIFNRSVSVDRSIAISKKISDWSKNLEISAPLSLKMTLMKKDRVRTESVDRLSTSPNSNTTETEDDIYCEHCNAKNIFGNCGNCYQPMCENCLNLFAFVTYPTTGNPIQQQVCGSCHTILTQKHKIDVNVRVGRYFIAQSGWKRTESEKEAWTFELLLSAKTQNLCAWSVLRSFDDFQVLGNQLYELLRKQERRFGVHSQDRSHYKGVDYSEVRNLTGGMKLLQTRDLESTEYGDVLGILQGFISDLAGSSTLCQSPIVQQFLNLEALCHDDHAGDGLAIIESEEDMMANEKVSSDEQEAEKDQSEVPKIAVHKLKDGTKWFGAKWNPWEANSQTKEGKVKLLQDMEESLVGVLNEIFEFDGIGMVRRQIFALSRSFIRAFLTSSHIRLFEKQFAAVMEPEHVGTLLDELHAVIKDQMKSEYVEKERTPPSASESHHARQECLKLILASVPTTFVSLFGENSCGAAAVKLHEFLQHETFVKNVAFSVWDEILLQVFPEYKTFKMT
ncbi:unnamed protein product [Albugo candida]|uniref:RUN domain-containing protein n=1 Tax=Albugo candida TaxID=65357 RepID=A0A024GCZ0_9STRA|nr:unnamed protein product [Albugo candida]|eukprot:CCI44547.1 unnamed protein product [Albugo candida]